MSKLEQAARQALEALEGSYAVHPDEAITALREALDHSGEADEMVQPVSQEPVAYMFKVKRTLPSSVPLDMFAAIEYHPLPHEDIVSKEPLYTAPQPVKEVELTDDEIYTLYSEPCSDREMVEFVRAVIAAHKEKNK